MIDCSKCIHCEVCGNRYANDGYAGECSYFLEYNPSGDCISREALSNVILNDRTLDRVNANWEVNRILAHIYNAPTVEPICPYLSDNEVKQPCLNGSCERPQGEWIIVKDEKWGDNVKCPFCGKELAGTDLNFCCKCGADMRGGA